MAACALFALPCAGPAQTNVLPSATGAVTVAEIIVTATRVEQELQSIPGTAYDRSAAQIQMRQLARTTPEALKGVPSVLVQKTSHGQGSPYLRGFTGFRTLCLIDGVRLNNSVFRDGPNQYWNTVDPFSLQGYELVMGPSSVLYGSDAIGGTLNALSIAPPDFNGQPAWDGRLYHRGASAERSSLGRLELGVRPAEQLGFVGGISRKEFGDLEGGKDVGRQGHTGYDEMDFDARIDYAFDPDSRLTLAHQAVDLDDAWRTHRTIYGIDWEGLAVGDEKKHILDQERDLTCLKYRGENLDGAIDAIQISLSRQAQQEDQFRVKKDDKSDQQGFDVETWGSTVQLESDTAAGTWVCGAEYYRDQVDSYSRKYKADGSLEKVEIQGPVADDASYDSLGIYLQDRIQLPGEQLELVPGVRYTYSKADADKAKDPISGRQMSVEGDWDAVVGSLKVLHPLVEQKRLVAFAGVSQGFRAPNLSDLTRLDTARSNEIETPVSDLDPEEFIACEAGLKARFERWTSQLAYYHTFIDDMIVRAPTGREIDGSQEVTKKNSGRGYVQGVEWSGAFDITPTWSTWLTASWMDGKVDGYPTSAPDEQREYVTRLMPPTAEVGLRWQRAGGKYWAEALCDAADKADKLSADDRRDTQRIPPGGTPGYAVFTVRGGSRITKNLELTVAAENLLDEDYRVHGSGVNEPGRNVVLAADYRF